MRSTDLLFISLSTCPISLFVSLSHTTHSHSVILLLFPLHKFGGIQSDAISIWSAACFWACRYLCIWTRQLQMAIWIYHDCMRVYPTPSWYFAKTPVFQTEKKKSNSISIKFTAETSGTRYQTNGYQKTVQLDKHLAISLLIYKKCVCVCVWLFVSNFDECCVIWLAQGKKSKFLVNCTLLVCQFQSFFFFFFAFFSISIHSWMSKWFQGVRKDRLNKFNIIEYHEYWNRI